MSDLWKLLIVSGVILVIVGLVVASGAKVPWLGRLPGDIYIQKKNFTFIFPLTTSILLSLFLTLIMIILRRR